METIPISSTFSGVALIRGEALIRGRRLFQCGYPKVRRLFENPRLLEEMRYLIVYWYTNKQVYFRFDCQSVESSRILDCLSASLLERPGIWVDEIYNFFLIHILIKRYLLQESDFIQTHIIDVANNCHIATHKSSMLVMFVKTMFKHKFQLPLTSKTLMWPITNFCLRPLKRFIVLLVPHPVRLGSMHIPMSGWWDELSVLLIHHCISVFIIRNINFFIETIFVIFESNSLNFL